MESVLLEDKLEDFYYRFILSICSKALVHFCIGFNCEVKLMEHQVDKNQASAMGFCLSLDKLVCLFPTGVYIVWCFIQIKGLEENMAVPPFCSLHFTLVSTLLE